jgi:hypothetical protein
LPSNKHWVGTWAAAPAPAEGVVGFNNHTLRMNPRISLGGDRVRVRISNAYGSRPLIIGAAQSRCVTKDRQSLRTAVAS